MNKLKILSIAICGLFYSLWSEAHGMDSVIDIKEGIPYRIKNKYNGNCLDNLELKTGQDTVGMHLCKQDGGEVHRLWYFEKSGEYYKIRNNSTRNCLDSSWSKVGFGGMGTVRCDQVEVDDHSLWYFEKSGEYYRIKNKYSGSGNCLDVGDPSQIGANTVGMQSCVNHPYQNCILWYFEKEFICNSTCTQTNFAELGRYKLFGSSFLSGAAYSFFPGMVSDVIGWVTGDHRAGAVAAIAMQGGAILYMTDSMPLPTIAGVTARAVCKAMGCSDETTAIAGSTTAVLTTVAQGLTFNQGAAIDSLTDCVIALAGSYAGSYLALQVKSSCASCASWVYNRLWNNPALPPAFFPQPNGAVPPRCTVL